MSVCTLWFLMWFIWLLKVMPLWQKIWRCNSGSINNREYVYVKILYCLGDKREIILTLSCLSVGKYNIVLSRLLFFYLFICVHSSCTLWFSEQLDWILNKFLLFLSVKEQKVLWYIRTSNSWNIYHPHIGSLGTTVAMTWYKDIKYPYISWLPGAKMGMHKSHLKYVICSLLWDSRPIWKISWLLWNKHSIPYWISKWTNAYILIVQIVNLLLCSKSFF
jgi:hypothetical protein